MKMRAVAAVLSVAVFTGALFVLPASGHQSLRRGIYECWLTKIATYSNFDLKIKDGGKYVWMRSDGTDKKAGTFVHDGEKIRFKSGYLKKQGFKGAHLVYTDSYDVVTHVIYLFKDSYTKDNLKYDCNNN